jgi:ML-like domain
MHLNLTTAAPCSRPCASLFFLLSWLSLATVALGQIQYIYGTDGGGVTRQLAVNRYPALYTGDFGDCLGDQSLFNVTKFDAAYYADNLTIVFHLDGTSNIKNESLMSKQ